MKRISVSILAVLILSLLVSAYSRTTQSGNIRKEAVTAQTVASQPAGKPYVMDLTRKGTVYEVATGVDFSRAQVRTSTGEQQMSALVKKLGLTGKFLFGTLQNLSGMDFGFPTGTLDPPDRTTAAKCDSLVCTCNGRQDCSDLSKSGKCGETAACGVGKGGRPGKWGCTCTKR
jgi:hypothetical protein